MPRIDRTTIAILATDGFEKVELTVPRDRLSSEGARVVVIAPGDSIRAWDEDDWGEDFAVDVQLSDADPADYDALVLPGGQINPDKLRANEDAVSFIRRFAETGRPVAAICHAPWLLIEAGLVEGREATSFESIRTDLRNAGATVKDESVVVDGNLVTSRNPDDLVPFCNAIIELIEEGRERSAA